MMQAHTQLGRVSAINGPILKARGFTDVRLRHLVRVGPLGLLGEIIRLDEQNTVIQTYEETTGLRVNDEIKYYPRPLSMELGPGLLNTIYDGIQRPLDHIYRKGGDFIPRGVDVPALSRSKKWTFCPLVKAGDKVKGGDRLGRVPETELIDHFILLPPHVQGSVVEVAPEGNYTVEDPVAKIQTETDEVDVPMFHYWPIRTPRPYARRLMPKEPLITGTRVIDLLFPIAKGGVFTIVGGFGTGKTVTQQNLAKWCDADIIVYIGCGERGNEMADLLEEFPRLKDPRTKRPLMERTILIGNTSNMPVSAREASIFAGLTMAEYYRDMGYHVTLLADSTSRWAEALREMSGRLEEMPAEGGYPAYLASRLSSFYERAGFVQTLGQGQIYGSVSITGAVSPPAGDFSDPITKTTKRFVRGFWALDAKLAYARHYPAISWVDSYSYYPDYIREWWDGIKEGWAEYRAQFQEILARSDELKNIVQLIGEEALPYEQQLVLFTAGLIKKAFLTQNAFDEVDRFCGPEKLMNMAKLICQYYERAEELLCMGVPFAKLNDLEALNYLERVKIDVANDDLDQFHLIRQILDEEFYELKLEFEGVLE